MKNTLILLTCFLFSNVHAQNTAEQNRFQGGVLLGLASSQIHGDGYAGFDKVGFNAGFYLENTLKDRLTLLTELVYITKGSYDPPIAEIGKFTTAKIKLSYVEMPVMLKYKINKLYLNGGLSLGVLVGEKQYRNEQLLFPDVIIGPFNKFEAAFLVGIEYELGAKTNVTWRHSMGISPIAGKLRQDPTFIGLIGGAFNQVMVLGLKYKF